MGRILKILGGLLLLCVVFAAIGVGLAFYLTQGVAATADSFMQAIQEDRFEDAYALMTLELQDEVDMDNFVESFDPMEIESWSFSSRNVENNLGSVSGTASIDGSAYVVNLGFVNADGEWLINAYNFVEASEEE